MTQNQWLSHKKQLEKEERIKIEADRVKQSAQLRMYLTIMRLFTRKL